MNSNWVVIVEHGAQQVTHKRQKNSGCRYIKRMIKIERNVLPYCVLVCLGYSEKFFLKNQWRFEYQRVLISSLLFLNIQNTVTNTRCTLIVMDVNETSTGLSRQIFSWPDYLVFTLTLLISSFVGVYHAWHGGGRTTSDYLMGGKQMSIVPIALSLAARLDIPFQ